MIRDQRHFRLFTCAALLVLASLACSIGVTQPSEPLFSAPNGNPIGTSTPAIRFPEDDPQPTVDVGELVSAPFDPTPAAVLTQQNLPPILYYAQPGDTLEVVAVRFGVDASEITTFEKLADTPFLEPGVVLAIPRRLENTTSSVKLLADSELIYSPSSADFDIEGFVENAGGYLSSYQEWLNSTEWTSGAQIIRRIALENSINPRLLLALLEYQSGWVYGQPTNLSLYDYPIGKIETQRKGLYLQLAWAVNQLSIGYYGWKEGRLTEIQFLDGVTARLAPELNSGTVALQYYFGQVYDSNGWVQSLSVEQGFPALYENMFGNQWLRAQEVEPLFPADLVQPELILPFFVGQLWSFTGGPHGAWEHDGAMAALDFAPVGDQSGCAVSTQWALAAAPGVIVRSQYGVVVIDLDGDGLEQTGWNIFYLHIANDGRVDLGEWVETGDLLGHPSCEGGLATGSHIHIARKYNGEWLPADGPIPFVLSGWMAHAGDKPYQGMLTKDGESIRASIYGENYSSIIRTRDEP
jgi:LasA protease